LRSLLESGGYKVHVYTSPHLVEWNERVVLAGQPITDEYLWEVHERCRVASEVNNSPVSYFEAATAAALLAFSEVPADAVILEVGMGGRWDATNVIPQPAVTVITPVSMDHAEYLGNTISLIAGEKSGIQRPGVSTVVAPQAREALDVILEDASRIGAHPLVYEKEWHYQVEPEQFSLHIGGAPAISYPLPALKGAHQVMNAAVALVALDAVSERFPVSIECRRRALLRANWPGRISRVLPRSSEWDRLSTFEIWADGAHNVSGAQVLGEWLKTQGRPISLVVGCSRGRSVGDFVSSLAIEKFERIIVVVGECSGVAMSELRPSDRRILEGLSRAPYLSCASLRDVLPILQGSSEVGAPSMLVVTGSLYLVGELYRQCGAVSQVEL
jgi:dihydrofolate synthase/folylpolyglutamate synthase